jgi:hypothetical protein
MWATRGPKEHEYVPVGLPSDLAERLGAGEVALADTVEADENLPSLRR